MDAKTAIQSLPEDRQTALKHWLVRQQLIANALGISMEDWSRHLDWAARNCFDGSYLQILDEHGDGDRVTSKQNRDAEKATGGASGGAVFGAIANGNRSF